MFISFHCFQSIIRKSQDSNREAGTDAGALEECFLLACSFMTFSARFLIGPSLQGRYHPQWTGTSHINHQLRICTKSFPTGLIYGSIFLRENPSSQMIIACVKLHKTRQHILVPDYSNFRYNSSVINLLQMLCQQEEIKKQKKDLGPRCRS